MKTKYTQGQVKVLYMFSLNDDYAKPTDAQVQAKSESWGFPNGMVGLNDAARSGISTLFPGEQGFRANMLLAPGFRVVKTGLGASQFEAEIDAVLAARR